MSDALLGFIELERFLGKKSPERAIGLNEANTSQAVHKYIFEGCGILRYRKEVPYNLAVLTREENGKCGVEHSQGRENCIRYFVLDENGSFVADSAAAAAFIERGTGILIDGLNAVSNGNTYGISTNQMEFNGAENFLREVLCHTPVLVPTLNTSP